MITEEIKPDYYNLEFKGIKFTVFQLVRAIRKKVPTFSFELATALKYIIRIKNESTEKRINDLEKAIECINCEINELKNL
jgi:hypothetical protein